MPIFQPKLYSKSSFWIKLFLLCLIQCVGQLLYGQDDCICNSGEKITICYYSTDRFCPPDTECRYTLDGTFMVNAIYQKLQNPSLFGPNGISKCPIALEVVDDVDSAEYLEQRECDIMFIGAFTDYDFANEQFFPSSIPQSDLLNIKEWSTKCPSNLTIVTQVEAGPWGYEFEDLNENPNVPDPNFTEYSIFNGTFGKVSSFLQGGSFQGIFTAYPSTGYSVLARDNNQEATIVLDSLTNDIILGDIGIFCGNNVGPISSGPNINHDRDRLACNIFDLGCKIATNSTTEFITICDGDNYTTAAGQVLFGAGIYIDSLLNIDGCDSLIYTLLEVDNVYDTLFTPLICDNPDYTVLLDGNIYSMANPVGMELLQSKDGCDSLVHIELNYYSSDSIYISESICDNDTFYIGNQCCPK